MDDGTELRATTWRAEKSDDQGETWSPADDFEFERTKGFYPYELDRNYGTTGMVPGGVSYTGRTITRFGSKSLSPSLIERIREWIRK